MRYLVPVPETVAPSDVVGLDRLKAWLRTRGLLWRRRLEGRPLRVPLPRGVLLCGIPGNGKSLSVKLIPHYFASPLFRLDAAVVASGAFGPPEAAFAAALREAETAAPCILWFDEIESAISRSATGDAVKDKLFGYFLMWLQEHPPGVFVAATANRIGDLPPELTRRGRFDEIFWVDVPGPEARTRLFELYIRRYCPEAALPPGGPAELARAAEGFTAAEIEQVVREVASTACAEDRTPGPEDFRAALAAARPVTRIYDAQLRRLRGWAFERMIPAD